VDQTVMNNDRLLNQFRMSAAMRPHVLRLRLRGRDFDFGSAPETAAAFTKRIGEMRRILTKKGGSVIAADQAIMKTLEAAVDHQLAEFRYRSLKAMEKQSHDMLDRLIEALNEFRDAIAKLAPSSKTQLNRQVSTIVRQPTFDTEVFIDLMETIAAALPKLSPPRQARAALTIILPESVDRRRPPIVDLWEAMPATTRVKVEGLMQQAKPSLVPWLDQLVELLHRERPTRKRGAPRAITRVFVSRTAAIWQTLGLNPGLAYNYFLYPATDKEIGRGGRIESRFQCYCNAALAAFGDFTTISARQVSHVKKGRRDGVAQRELA
jgi:hypothetical protein